MVRDQPARKKTLSHTPLIGLAVRLELVQKPGAFAQVATLLAEEGTSLGTADIASADKTRVVRDVTFDSNSEKHGQ